MTVRTAFLLYDDETEMKLHSSAIHSLSLNSGLPEGRIRGIYEFELRRLKETAKVKEFLSVLVIKKVKKKMVNTEG